MVKNHNAPKRGNNASRSFFRYNPVRSGTRHPSLPPRRAIRKPRSSALARRAPASPERQCALHYAETILNPFDTPAGACVPVTPCLDSAKRKIFARGIGQVQSNGFGGIIANTSMVNDSTPVVFTNGTSTVGNSFSTITPTGATSVNSNSELSEAEFAAAQVQGRVVACGIRIRYTGKQVDMNGTVYAMEEPSHLTTGKDTPADLLALDRVKPKNFNRQWVVASWQPVLPSETAYSTNYAASAQPIVPYPLIILIQCQNMTAGETLPFEWEWYLHYEAVGSSARGKSASHIAPVAGPKVMSALQSAPTGLFDDVSNRLVSSASIATKMADHGSSWRFLGDVAQRVVASGAAAITSRAASQYVTGGLMALAM